MTQSMGSKLTERRSLQAIRLQDFHVGSHFLPMVNLYAQVIQREVCGFGIGRRGRITEQQNVMIKFALGSLGIL